MSLFNRRSTQEPDLEFVVLKNPKKEVEPQPIRAHSIALPSIPLTDPRFKYVPALHGKPTTKEKEGE